MTFSSLFQRYATYNTWANEQYATWLGAHPEILDTPVESSFKSLKETVRHVWGAQTIWLDRLNGRSPILDPTASFSGTPDDLWEAFINTSRNFESFLAAQPEAFFDGTLTYRNLAGKEFTSHLPELLLHIFQHSTFHRGQMLTLGRQLGLSAPPATDLIHFTRVIPE